MPVTRRLKFPQGTTNIPDTPVALLFRHGPVSCGHRPNQIRHKAATFDVPALLVVVFFTSAGAKMLLKCVDVVGLKLHRWGLLRCT